MLTLFKSSEQPQKITVDGVSYILDKQQIITRFNAAHKSYDAAAHVQKVCAQILAQNMLNVMPNFSPATVLDLGTGTGFMPDLLLPMYDDAAFTLNDIAPHMIKVVQSKFNNRCVYDIQDFETGIFHDYDLIVSNFAFQWSNNLKQTLTKFYEKSDVLAFACLLDGTFKEWEHILGYCINQYPEEHDLCKFLRSLRANPCYVESRVFTVSFESVRLFCRYLNQLGASYSPKVMPMRVLKKILSEHNHPFSVTYNVFFAVLKRL